MRKNMYTPRKNNVEDLTSPELSRTLDNQEFLPIFLIRPSFVMVHSSVYQMNVFRNYKYPDQLYIDGTFRTAPTGSKQIITIRLRKDGSTQSKLVATAILKSKRKEDYCELWEALAKQINALHEERLIMNMDFETSHLKAVQSVFGNRVKVVACAFHLIQSVHRRLKKELFYQGKYLNIERKELDDDIRTLILSASFEEDEEKFKNKYQQSALNFTNT